MSGKVLLLGGSGDIGTAIGTEFQRRGYIVTAPTHAELNLEESSEWGTYFSRAGDDYDVVVHSAGINIPKVFESLSLDDFLRTSMVNCFSLFGILQFLIPGMKKRKRGNILAISSLYSVFSRVGRLPYSVSKHGLNGMIKTLALELAPNGILVNSLSPGFVDTKMTRKNNSAAVIEALEKKIPLGRLAHPEEIARVAYFLCSPDNTYMNGQNIIIDGGFSIGGGQG